MNIYTELGIEPLINASGTITIYGGSLMPEEVIQAMNSAARNFVDIRELHQAAGRRIAEIIGVEGAHVCACASAGITLMAAACMAGKDPDRIHRLPRSDEMPNIFLVQHAHRNGFDHAIEVAGGILLEIEPTEAALRAGLQANPVAAVTYTHSWMLNQPALSLSESAWIAHEYGVPLILDAAAEVPPAENLTRFIREGADLVVFSGGKDIRGPQTSGFILGKRDLVEACAANDCPNVGGIARGMKTGKEEIAGLVKAIELYVNQNHPARMTQLEQMIADLQSEFASIHFLQTVRQMPIGVGQLVPHLVLRWEQSDAGFSCAEAAEFLRQGKPPIAVRLVESLDSAPEIWVCVQTLRPGEEHIVAQALKKILCTAM